MSNEKTKPNKPSFELFHVSGEGENAKWKKIGAAWSIKNGKGLNIRFDYPIVVEKLVALEPKPKTES